jgi:hypothetical protein
VHLLLLLREKEKRCGRERERERDTHKKKHNKKTKRDPHHTHYRNSRPAANEAHLKRFLSLLFSFDIYSTSPA